MEVEITSTSILTDKGKAPENIISPINKESLDYNQSFDIAENMLDKNNGNNALHFKCETGPTIFFFHYCDSQKSSAGSNKENYLGNTLDDSIHTSGSWADETEKDFIHHQYKYQPSQLDAILTQINNVSQQLADIHNNLTFILTRVNTIETILNISSISPEQAKIINSNLLKGPIDDMDEDSDQNDVVTLGIDILESIIYQ
ncbi:14309_t:CDS:2 [Funneliformis geosporum]|nr:14309_t:CDS:2 [Funneliformis geosporum]